MTSTERLYHYTTPDGLIGIVKTNTLWASSVFYLNDSRELVGGIQAAQSRIRRMRDAITDSQGIDRIDWLLHDLRDFGKVSLTKPVFVCSLSSERDQLSQWRAYSRGGGFAIGFPAHLLREGVRSQKFLIHACRYSEADKDELIDNAIEKMLMPWIGKTGPPVAHDNERFHIAGQLAWQLLRIASQIKDESFSEERESRIVSQPERRYDAESLHFRSRNGLVVPYTTIRLPDDMDFWGEVDIVVGPTPHPAESKASVYDLVRRFRGFAIGIDISRTPYRDW